MYSPAVETRFSVRFKAFTNAKDASTGSDFEIDKIFDFFIGVETENRQKVSNARGGSFGLTASGNEAENSGVVVEAGTFLFEGSLTANPTAQITCGIARAQNVEESTRTSKNRSAPGLGVDSEPDPYAGLPPVLAQAMRTMNQIKKEARENQEKTIAAKGAAPFGAGAIDATQVANNTLGAFYDFPCLPA